MAEPLRLLCVLAHPDDESLGNGGILAHYAAEGVETYLLTATRGERGWTGAPEDNPGLTALGRLREGELMAATKLLGLRDVCLLDYIDGDLDQAPPQKIIGEIAAYIRHIRPQVVVTFGADGAYGHPDHIAISQFTGAAIVCAADSSFTAAGEPFRVSKLYYMALSKQLATAYERVFGDLIMNIDGVDRSSVIWPDWAITTQVDTAKHWETVWNAVQCHRSQLTTYEQLVALSEVEHRILWGSPSYYRVFSMVNTGRTVETDLFEGLR